MDELEAATRALVEKLDEMQDNESLRTVFTIAHVHGFSYTGPNYQAELTAARNVLKSRKT